MIEENIYDIAFSMDQSLTPIEKKMLLAQYGSSKEILSLNKNFIKSILGRGWTGSKFDKDKFINEAEKIAGFMEKASIKIVRFNEEGYPFGLKNIPDLPFLLYYRGNISYDYDKSISIVGTRTPDYEGKVRSEFFTKFMTENNYTIISGLAEGIDSFAHKTAIDNGGNTIAVLGCGIDRIYPSENRDIAKSILEKGGGIISEYPPGTPPRKWYFPKRNRLIAGLSKAVLIVQSPKRSGSLITAFLCADYNKDLFVCSPSKDKEIDEGNVMLIKTGAKEVSSPYELLKDYA